MSRSLGQAFHPTVPLSTQQSWCLVHESKVWSTCADYTSVAEPCQGKESAEHACKHGYQIINWYFYLCLYLSNYVKHQAIKQKVSFSQCLIWPSRSLNLRPHNCRADTLISRPLEFMLCNEHTYLTPGKSRVKTTLSTGMYTTSDWCNFPSLKHQPTNVICTSYVSYSIYFAPFMLFHYTICTIYQWFKGHTVCDNFV